MQTAWAMSLGHSVRDRQRRSSALSEIPVRQIRLTCQASRAFAFPSAGTLEPYYILRGMIGAALTARSRELGLALFKPDSLRDLGGDARSEAPGTPWRLRLSHLYAREIACRFDFEIDLFGEEPCDRAAELVDAVRLAGSGEPYHDWRSGGLRRWGLQIPSFDGRQSETVAFEVVNVRAPAPVQLGSLCNERTARWRKARSALLVFRTLTILREKSEGMGSGTPLAVTGELNAAALIGNALRRLAVLDFATRRDPIERRWPDLRATVAEKERVLAAVAAEFPLRCADAVTVPLQWSIGRQRSLRGLIGSARFEGTAFEPWCLGFTACELLGVGESTSYGAGQVTWVPLG